MHFHLSKQQRERQNKVRKFASEELGANVSMHDREGTFPRGDWVRCSEYEVLRSHIPEEYGGLGLSATDTVLTLEALGYGCRDNGLTLALGGQTWSVQEPILEYGSEEQKQRYLPRLCSGEWIGSHAVTEMESGSDALSLQTRAQKVDGGYLLNGRKAYIGMAPVADLAVVLANTDPEAGKWGVSAFIVESSFDGFSQSSPRGKTGTRTNLLGDLIFENCLVPEENLLGGEGVGVSLFTQTIAWERAFIHAGHMGAMQYVFEQCIDYANKRRQFGQPISGFQSVSNRIADMRLRLETSRLLMYQAASRKDAMLDASIECAMAKLHIGESLLECATDAVRIHGARGYLDEYEIERHLRDSIGGVIYAGTSDIQRNLIASLAGVQG